MSDHNAATATGDHYTTREQEALGRYTHLGLLRYKDLFAGYCVACQRVYGVECPRCGTPSGDHYNAEGDRFKVEHPIETVRSDGHNWTATRCAKCDFKFRVIVQSGVYR